jgi:hypothetical protein
MKKLAIIGASGHGKVIADIAAKNGYQEIVFLDDDESISECGGSPQIYCIGGWYERFIYYWRWRFWSGSCMAC